MAKLILESGGEAREFPLGDTCRIGREPGNEVCLDDAGSSRKHCRIARDGAQYVLEDLKSANGTFRNEERVDRVVLADGDVIRIGSSNLRFSTAPAAPAAAADRPEEIQLEDPAAPAAPPAAGAARYALAFVRGECEGRRVKLVGERVTLGRKAGNTVPLKDVKVSGLHAEVALEDGRPVLRDLGSTNGTFLEGKRIDEIALSHGDRVVLGDSEFVLLDTTRPEPPLDRAASAGDRTMIDAPELHKVKAVARSRSPAGALGLLLLLAAVCGAGWFYWKVARRGAAAAAPPAAPGNLLGAAWSFETEEGAPALSTVFDFAAGPQGAFEVRVGGARSGAAVLAAEPAGGGALALQREGIELTGLKLAVSGFVKASDGAAGTLAAQFRSAADEDYRVTVPIGSSSAPEWRELRAELVPPTGATHVHLALTALGDGGTVAFDDLSVVAAGVGRVAAKSLKQFEFERAGPSLLVRRGPDPLLEVGPLAFTSGDLGERSVDRCLVAEGGADAGEVLLPGGRRAGYTAAFSTDERSAQLRLEWRDLPAEAAAAVPLRLLPAVLDEPVSVLRTGGVEPYQDSFQADGVGGLLLGKGSTRVRVSFEPALTLRAARKGSQFLIALCPPQGASGIAIRMQVDFVEEKAKAAELMGDAKAKEAAGALGEALAALDRIASEFPYDEVILADAEQRRQGILRRRDELERDLKAAALRAEFLKSPAAFVESEKQAASAAAAFAGTSAAEAFESRRKDLAAAREALVREVQDVAAERLLKRLETALAQRPPAARVAREIRDTLAQRFPWSKAAARAAESMQAAGKDGE